MKVEIVSVGSEILLGQLVDTNAVWLSGRLAEHGIDSHFRTTVGDNTGRIASVLRGALARSDAVVACGGLGPTADDVTRDALGIVMNVPLLRDGEVAGALGEYFERRGRPMPASNLRQADVPEGATILPAVHGTAPGLRCPVGLKTVYALPGVPAEMREMFDRCVLPELVGSLGGGSVIASRAVRVWGLSESHMAEMVSPRLDAAERSGGKQTLAFLASGTEGLVVRVTVKAGDAESAKAMLDDEERSLVEILGAHVFGIDDATMEDAVARKVVERGVTLCTAESLTGGQVAARLVRVVGASSWFRGSVVAYDPGVKHSLLGVPPGPVVSEGAARSMAKGAREVLGADIAVALTGVAGPSPSEGVAPGTVHLGLAGPGMLESATVVLPGDRQSVRDLATISALDFVRRRL